MTEATQHHMSRACVWCVVSFPSFTLFLLPIFVMCGVHSMLGSWTVRTYFGRSFFTFPSFAVDCVQSVTVAYSVQHIRNVWCVVAIGCILHVCAETVVCFETVYNLNSERISIQIIFIFWINKLFILYLELITSYHRQSLNNIHRKKKFFPKFDPTNRDPSNTKNKLLWSRQS